MVRLVILFASMMSFASMAVAADGELEINQACAGSSVGCFPGDSAGFPVSITQPGSYRFTPRSERRQRHPFVLCGRHGHRFIC